jgi:hypothetical protein
MQQIQPSGSSVEGRHSLWQSTASQFLHQPWANPVVAAKGIAQANNG